MKISLTLPQHQIWDINLCIKLTSYKHVPSAGTSSSFYSRYLLLFNRHQILSVINLKYWGLNTSLIIIICNILIRRRLKHWCGMMSFVLYGFGMFCIRSRLLAKASCFFFSISAAEHFDVIWLVTKTLLLIAAESDWFLLKAVWWDLEFCGALAVTVCGFTSTFPAWKVPEESLHWLNVPRLTWLPGRLWDIPDLLLAPFMGMFHPWKFTVSLPVPGNELERTKAHGDCLLALALVFVDCDVSIGRGAGGFRCLSTAKSCFSWQLLGLARCGWLLEILSTLSHTW